VAPKGASATAATHDLGWILLAFAIFNTYMLLWSTMVNAAVFGVFLTLELTEIILCIGFFGNNANIIKVGGYVGILTALVAWYASAASVVNGMRGTPVPAGRQALRHGADYLTKGPQVIPGVQAVPGITCLFWVA
jgi:succinate-acetate transporter protein